MVKPPHGTVYSPIKKNGILIHNTTWMNFENIMLSERFQTQKATFYMIQLDEMFRIDKSIEAESKPAFVRWCVERGIGFEVSFW